MECLRQWALEGPEVMPFFRKSFSLPAPSQHASFIICFPQGIGKTEEHESVASRIYIFTRVSTSTSWNYLAIVAQVCEEGSPLMHLRGRSIFLRLFQCSCHREGQEQLYLA